jgi:AraC-like DNA-binding protein
MFGAMDALSDLLRVVRLDGAYFYPVEAAEPWTVVSAGARELAPRILPGSEHLISYHILIKGRCFAGLTSDSQVELLAGDVVLFPHGDATVLSSARGLRIAAGTNTRSPARYPETVLLGERGSCVTSFVCGFLGCDRRPFNPLLSALPPLMHVRGMVDTWPGGFTRQLVEESRHRRAGSDTVLTRLAELMFIEVLRRYLADLPLEQSGWLAGLRDEMVGQALSLLHRRPDHRWTLQHLAREVAASRSVLVRRFTELVGQPPMQYLAKWRMQVAANLLLQRRDKVAAIATEVGYDSEAAFSRAFKKATGMAPGAWREARGSAATLMPAA